MKMTKDLKPLTRAESELMNLLWDAAPEPLKGKGIKQFQIQLAERSSPSATSTPTRHGKHLQTPSGPRRV